MEQASLQGSEPLPAPVQPAVDFPPQARRQMSKMFPDLIEAAAGNAVEAAFDLDEVGQPLSLVRDREFR